MAINKKLLLIFSLALFLRLVSLQAVPFGFHNDEVDSGYEGLFILKNGHDTYGNVFPIYFDKFGDFRPTGLFYLNGISGLLLGPSVFSTRLPGALVGAFSVLVIYCLYLALFKPKSRLGGLLSAFILAILPWHVVLSRATQEAILGIFLITSGVVLLIKYFDKPERKFLLLAIFCLFLSYFFYSGFRFLVPLLLLAFTFELWRQGKILKNKVFIVVTLAFLLLTMAILSTPGGSGRVSQVIFYNNLSFMETGQQLAFGDGPGNVLTARIFHNKLVVSMRYLLANYMPYFSGDFLFVRGGLPDRYVVPHQGLVYFVLLPFLIAGLMFLLVNFRTTSLLAIYAVLLAPIPAIFTFDDVPNMNRVSFMIIPLVLLAVYGFERLTDFVRMRPVLVKLVLGGFGMILVLELSYFTHQYLIHHNQHRPFLRDDSVSQLVQYVFENKIKYDKIVVQETITPIYYWFFTNNFDPNLRIKFNERPYKYEFENILFLREPCPTKRLYEFDTHGSLLIIDGGDCEDVEGFREIARWLRKDQKNGFKALVLEQ